MIPLKHVFLSFICPLFFSSICSCQSEEPTVEDQLVGYWQSERVLVDGQETAIADGVHIDMQNNEYRRVFEMGSWSLSKNKDSIVFFPNNTGEDSYAMAILRLDEGQLWLSQTTNGQLQEEYYTKSGE